MHRRTLPILLLLVALILALVPGLRSHYSHAQTDPTLLQFEMVSQFMPDHGFQDVLVDGTTLYLLSRKDTVHIADVSDPTSPTLLGTYTSEELLGLLDQSLVVLDGFLYMPATGNFQVIDVTDPVSPTLVGEYMRGMNAGYDDIEVAGDTAYMTGRGDLGVFDVSNPAEPQRLGKAQTTGSYYGGAQDIAVSDNLVLVADGGEGLKVVDVSDPTNPTIVGNYPVEGDNIRYVTVVNGYAYAYNGIGRIFIIDISTPTAPTLAGSLYLGVAGEMKLQDNLLYIPRSGVQSPQITVVDVSDPVNPVVVGEYGPYGDPFALDVQDDLVYMAWDGIHILRVSEAAPTPTPTSTPQPATTTPTPGGATPTPTLEPRDPKPWTVMLYFALDNNLAEFGISEIDSLERIADNPDVNFVALFDGLPNGDTAYYHIQHDTDIGWANYTEGVNKWSQNEKNIGDPSTLVDFATWALQEYPAERYALVIFDHGNGIAGVAFDESSDDDYISVKEMGEALNTITSNGSNKIDVLFMHACLMGLIEDGYEIRQYVDYYVASENIGWATIPSIYEEYFAGLNSSTDARTLAVTIADEYSDFFEQRSFFQDVSYTISATDMSQIDTLAAAVNTLSTILKADIEQYASAIAEARSAAQKFDWNGDSVLNDQDAYIDLYDFAMQLQDVITDTNVQTATQAVMDAVDQYVIAEHHRNGELLRNTVNLEDSSGVAIFFPPLASPYYNQGNYLFADGANWGSNRALAQSDGSTWGAFLVDYFDKTQPGEDTLNSPPDPIEPIPVIDPAAEEPTATPTEGTGPIATPMPTPRPGTNPSTVYLPLISHMPPIQ